MSPHEGPTFQATVPRTEVPIGDDDLRDRIRVLCDKPVWARQYVDEDLLRRLDASPVAPLLLLLNGRAYVLSYEAQFLEHPTAALEIAHLLAERIRGGTVRPRKGAERV